MSDFYENRATVPTESKPLSDPSPPTTADSEATMEPGPAAVEPAPAVVEPGPAVVEPAPAATEPAPAVASPDILPPDPPAEDPAVTRFKSCRWYETQEGDGLPDYCSNRDVLPFAGKNGFKPDAWCAECELFKVKRTTKKRKSVDDWDHY